MSEPPEMSADLSTQAPVTHELTDERIDSALAPHVSDAVPPMAVRRRSVRQVLLAGELPFLAAAILAAGAFVAGQHAAPQVSKVATAEKGAIVLETMLAHPGADEAYVDRQLRQPILAVVQKYADRGYTVLDTSKDESGNLAVVGMPAGVIDITDELRRAVHEASPVSTSPSAPSAELGTKASISGAPAHE